MLIRLVAMLAAFSAVGLIGRMGLVDYPTMVGLLVATFVAGVGPLRLLRFLAGVAMVIFALGG